MHPGRTGMDGLSKEILVQFKVIFMNNCFAP